MSKAQEAETKAEALDELEAEHGSIRVFCGLADLLLHGSFGDSIELEVHAYGLLYYIEVPAELLLYCDTHKCRRTQEFSAVTRSKDFAKWDIRSRDPQGVSIDYMCRYCFAIHSFSLSLNPTGIFGLSRATKTGEWPLGGEPLSDALVSLAGDGKSKDLLRKGYECELTHKGIGAYAYYRRFIEYRTKTLLKRVREIAVGSECSEEVLSKLDQGIATTEYQRALEIAIEIVPSILATPGVNPFKTLFAFVSGGLHKGSDSECLSSATEARLILQYITARIESIINDRVALRMALNKANERAKGRTGDTGNLAISQGDDPR